MEEALIIQVRGEIRQMLNCTPEELARDMPLYSALMLFRLGELSSGAAAEMAEVPRVMFLDLCAEYVTPVPQITVWDLLEPARKAIVRFCKSPLWLQMDIRYGQFRMNDRDMSTGTSPAARGKPVTTRQKREAAGRHTSSPPAGGAPAVACPPAA